MRRRISPEILLIPMIGAALLAALLLGGLAFFLSRHEEAFRREELRNLLRAECRLFAERCAQELDAIRAELELRAAQTPPDAAGIRRAIAAEPFFIEGFVADRSGRLLYAGNSNDWRRRYGELFTELVSAKESPPPSPAPAAAPEIQARTRSKLVEPVPMRQTAQRLNLGRSADSFAEALPAMEKAEAKPAAAKGVAEPRMIPRFAALTRNRASGYIPWFADNRFAPLVWAANSADPGKIVGFELESIVLWSRLTPLFPQRLPDYFRIELADASDRVIHAAGGEIPPDGKAEPVLIMPFSELLLPNAQIRASLIPEKLPLGSYRAIVWIGISAPILVILFAGLLLYRLIRRELRLSAQKTGFVSQVSHELKTPLTSIRMYSELLHDHDRELAPEKRRNYLRILLEESERLSRLVGNVLDFGRLDEGRKRYAPEEIELPALLADAVERNRERAAASGIEINLQLTQGEEIPRCRIDRDSLLQVLHNLFDNAVKYAAEGKKIDLSLGRDANGRREIRLRDYGPGIPPGSEERIFRKFYRVDSALDAKVSGFGLGLAIARGLLRDQKGDLKAAAANPGLLFIITLPGETEHGTL